MVTRRTVLAGIGCSLLPGAANCADRELEPEFLEPQLKARSIPPLVQRIPKRPRIVGLKEMGRIPGRYGGTVRTIIGSAKDIRFMTIYGYARLVGYDEKLNFQPDILEAFEADRDTVFTFTLRDGHRWSDGSPLTADDFRYWWEDVILNKDLTPGGGSLDLRVDGKLPRFEVLDALTIRYSWDAPNPNFLPSIAAPQPLILVGPSAYLKKFHEKYQDSFRLAALMQENRVKKWADLHIKMAREYRPENPELPTLYPWRNTTKPPAEQFVFERNPFFHRVDENGRQLPYIDRFILNVSSSAIIAAKTGAGESELQATGIDFSDYTFLKDAEKRYPVKVDLWKSTRGSRVAIFPNLNCQDEVWRRLFHDVRVRRALSLAIDRHEINMAVFFGLATPSADTVLPESPLFRPEYANAWIAHDPEEANRLLDQAGLDKRNGDDIRLLPDGRPAEITIETPGESSVDTDVLELVTDHWRRIGIALFVRTSQREIFRSRAMGGRIMMSIWYGLDNGVATADMNPGQLAPTMDDQMQWPLWGMHHLSHGEQGTAPDMPTAVELAKLLDQWQKSAELKDRTAIWHKMLSLYTQEVLSIGIVNGTEQPILRSSRLQNVPSRGLYGFNPTCYLGVYMPDTFWFSEGQA
ncbi:ABC transporter substrate-binding protein [Phyllobacterium sp. 0TCS1.6C]|uniref:ABC transporter substrate-binding protein n=1 Tax=unclassified Phyllobacterium TaxID=2638441 RepID=UPI00226468A4|nr:MULTISPECIES: ABC transporter substrate-binding protein [unclassified Phyllobacterium]MCX8280958.1 ABC transporter substrate-binding protein [Phyllobacterium sp. 0TCS1.6C]MCX8295824.1 ABC transporter substrate-binding protein [Phyllobacterium sp. 0TCS1.6A]